MKTCPYCGKENSDDATVCVIDQQPLAPEDELIARTGPSREEVRARMAARPLTVEFAVGLLALGVFLDIIVTVSRNHSYGIRQLDFYLSAAYTFGLVILVLWFAFRGKNWARWIIVGSTVLGVLARPLVMIGPAHWDFYFHLFIDIVAIVALFLPPSNDWYRGPQTASNQPVSVS